MHFTVCPFALTAHSSQKYSVNVNKLLNGLFFGRGLQAWKCNKSSCDGAGSVISAAAMSPAINGKPLRICRHVKSSNSRGNIPKPWHTAKTALERPSDTPANLPSISLYRPYQLWLHRRTINAGHNPLNVFLKTQNITLG
jgi:hypothetical protein